MDEIKPGSVTINLEKPEKKEEVKEEKLDISAQIEKLSKTVNYLSANLRHDDKLAKRVEEIYEKLSSKEPTDPINTGDPLDDLAQKDWKAAVKQLAREEAVAIRNKERETENIAKTQDYISSVLEKSKSEVMSKHPEIETDPTSDKAQIFQRIVREHPDYLTNPYGPKLAMNDMENELREKGWIDPDTNKRVDKEVNRRERLVKTASPKDKSSEGNKIVLDSDAQNFCKANRIPYEDYAKYVKTLSGGGKEGVTVNE